MDLPPPSTADWGDIAGDFDLDYAFRKFGGQTYREAIRLFETTDLLSRVEDLSVMPDIAFRYYMLAYRDFVLSPRVFEINYGIDASTAADSFLNLIMRRLETSPASIKPILSALLPAAQYISERQVEYSADEDIYGKFSDAMLRIQALAVAASHVKR
jgi:hypothetical protein